VVHHDLRLHHFAKPFKVLLEVVCSSIEVAPGAAVSTHMSAVMAPCGATAVVRSASKSRVQLLYLLLLLQLTEQIWQCSGTMLAAA
jgi:hypothetical protein